MEQTECDVEVFDKLQATLQAPDFLHTLSAVRGKQVEEPKFLLMERHFDTPSQSADGDSSLASGSTATANSPQASSAATFDDFIVVSKDDAVEALAYYLASCIVNHPEAQGMPPKQLQEALVEAVKGLRKSKFKQLCSWGRCIYRWTAVGYSALQMYNNPWLVQAVLTAVWTFSRLSIRYLL